MQTRSLPRATKAAILTELRTPLVVESIRLPDELDVGQVLVQVHFSGICGSQLGEINGAKGTDPYLPHLLGHEGSATVLRVGPGVSHLAPGDRVVLHWRKGRGIESRTPTYGWNGLKVNAGRVTTFNEYAVVSENRCTPIPQDLDLEVAALFGCAVTTGFGVVENNAEVRAGESVVVYGSGGVGLNVVQAAALHSAHPIIGVDLHRNRLDLATRMGASHVIDGGSGDVEDQISEIVGSAGVDVFIDNTGVTAVVELGYRITKPQGRVVLVGVPDHGKEVTIPPLPLHFGKALIGSHGGESSPDRDIPRILGLYGADKVRLRDLVTETVSLDGINEAIDGIRSGAISGRCMIFLSETP